MLKPDYKKRSIVANVMLLDESGTHILQSLKPYNCITEDFETSAEIIVKDNFNTPLVQGHFGQPVKPIVDIVADEEYGPFLH